MLNNTPLSCLFSSSRLWFCYHQVSSVSWKIKMTEQRRLKGRGINWQYCYMQLPSPNADLNYSSMIEYTNAILYSNTYLGGIRFLLMCA
jgi:hypothetical protein